MGKTSDMQTEMNVPATTTDILSALKTISSAIATLNSRCHTAEDDAHEAPPPPLGKALSLSASPFLSAEYYSVIGKKRRHSQVDESCPTSTSCLQGTDAVALKQEVRKLASILQLHDLEQLASAIAACKEHARDQVSAPAKRAGSLPLAKRHHLHSSDSTAETASQQSGKTLCEEERHAESGRELGQAPTVIRRQTSRRRLDLDLEAPFDAFPPIDRRRMDSLAAVVGDFLGEGNDQQSGQRKGGQQQCTDSDNSSSGWTMRSGPAHGQDPKKLPAPCNSTGTRKLARVVSLEGWGGIQKRTSRAADGKLVPGRSHSLSKAASRQHSEREAPTPLLATPSPERLRQGLRRQSTVSPLTSPDLHSHDGLSGTDTPPPVPWVAERSGVLGSPSSKGNTGLRKAEGGSSAEGTRDSSRLGAWTSAEKQSLVQLVRELKPSGASSWEMVAERLGRWSPGGASAERMYRTLTDPTYQRSTNKHGRRINSRNCTPMHVMAAHALRQLPNQQGNLNQIAEIIAATPEFKQDLDWSARPGTKTYPRWKDALVGCFKQGRYPHLFKHPSKVNGLNVYYLDENKMEGLAMKRRRRLSSTSSRDITIKTGQSPSVQPPALVLNSTGGVSSPVTASPWRPAGEHPSSLAQSGDQVAGTATPPHFRSLCVPSPSPSILASTGSHVLPTQARRTTDEEGLVSPPPPSLCLPSVR